MIFQDPSMKVIEGLHHHVWMCQGHCAQSLLISVGARPYLTTVDDNPQPFQTPLLPRLFRTAALALGHLAPQVPQDSPVMNFL